MSEMSLKNGGPNNRPLSKLPPVAETDRRIIYDTAVASGHSGVIGSYLLPSR